MPEDQVILEGFTSSLGKQAANNTLQLITCGSVDDGKSTLIGRLLYESKMIFDDQLAALHKEARSLEHRVKRSILHCLSMACLQNASRASQLM